ncbi:MAG: DUF4340 domain-containing protein [Pseudomonadota bacterium]
MSAVHHQSRRKTALTLLAIAVGLWVSLGLMSLATSGPGASQSRMGSAVLSDFGATRVDASRIRFTLADESYTLERSSKGWVMAETGGYPVRLDRIADLASGLETLSYDERRTDDPYKHDRLGLGDPTEGGNGVLVEVFGPENELSHAVIVGRKNEDLYVRDPGNTQSYRADGSLPPFYNRRAWLDLDIVDIDPAAIRSVRIIDSRNRTLYLRRAEGSDSRSFAPAPPNQNDRLISRLAASASALAITRLSPQDVKPAEDLINGPIARHISETFDGLEINLQAYREPNGFWVTLRAIEAGEGARRAEVINEKAEGWAFRISDYDFQDFTPSVTSIVEPAPAPSAP